MTLPPASRLPQTLAPAVLPCLAFVGGVALGRAYPLQPATWLTGVGLCLSALLLPRCLRRFCLHPLANTLLILCLALLLGAARYALVQPRLEPGVLAWYNDRGAPCQLSGLLVAPPDRRDGYDNLRLRAERLQCEGEPTLAVQGLALAAVEPGGGWRYGDRVRLSGALETPWENEEFSYRDYLARQGIGTQLRYARGELLERGQGNRLLAALFALREASLRTVYRLLPDPEASLLAGILLGVETGIPEDVRAAFRDSGVAHVIAISGFNISLISGMLVALLQRRLGVRRGALAASAGIGLYTLLVGADAAVVRAALMGGLGLLGRQVGRRQDGLNSLAVVAAFMLLINPLSLWDPGFQLSFTATLGLVLYAEPFSAAFTAWAAQRFSPAVAQRIAGPVGEWVLFTLAAQLTTLPVMIAQFGRVSLIAPFANPVVLPVQPAIMALGGAAVLLGLVWLPLGQAFAWLAWPALAFTVRAAEFFAALPYASLPTGRASSLLALLLYMLLFGPTFRLPLMNRIRALLTNFRARWQAQRPMLPSFPLLSLGGLAILTVLVWQAVFAAPDGRLHLTVLDVSTNGQSGEAVLVVTPGGRRVLINGGPSAIRLSQALGRRLPLLDRKLDWLVVAGMDEEQIGALPSLLERYPPQAVLWAGEGSSTRPAGDLQEALLDQEIAVTLAGEGQALDLGEGATLRVVALGRKGAVLLLEWGSFRAWLPLGPDQDALERLEADRTLAPVTALLLTQGGYAPANPPALLQRLHPQVALLSLGAGGARGLPAPEPLAALEGVNLLRTDRNGWIELVTDGAQLWVEVERR